jgi:hypothetical protein
VQWADNNKEPPLTPDTTVDNPTTLRHLRKHNRQGGGVRDSRPAIMTGARAGTAIEQLITHGSQRGLSGVSRTRNTLEPTAADASA